MLVGFLHCKVVFLFVINKYFRSYTLRLCKYPIFLVKPFNCWALLWKNWGSHSFLGPYQIAIFVSLLSCSVYPERTTSLSCFVIGSLVASLLELAGEGDRKFHILVCGLNPLVGYVWAQSLSDWVSAEYKPLVSRGEVEV